MTMSHESIIAKREIVFQWVCPSTIVDYPEVKKGCVSLSFFRYHSRLPGGKERLCFIEFLQVQ